MSNLPISSMRLEPLPLQSAQRRAQILFLTQGVALGLLALGPLVVLEHFLLPEHRAWTLFDGAVVGAMAVTGLHAYLVRDYGAALRWSLVALGCLALVLISLRAFADPEAMVGLLALAAFGAMLLAVQATRPGVRACVIDAIGKNAEARAARARAARNATSNSHRQDRRAGKL